MRTINISNIFFRFASIFVTALLFLYTLPRAGFSVFETLVLTALIIIVLALLNIMRDVAQIAKKGK
jgi:hypothetical protein